MLSEKIKTLRKEKGYTQEELSMKLNVARQTISKWEKRLSIPDAEMLIKIADIFEISTSELLGENFQSNVIEMEQSEISKQLGRINEKLATKDKWRKKIQLGLGIVLLLAFIDQILPSWNKMWYDLGVNLSDFFNL